MGFDQEGPSVFCEAPDASGQWDVNEEGFEKPLALFTQALFKSYADAPEISPGSTKDRPQR